MSRWDDEDWMYAAAEAEAEKNRLIEDARKELEKTYDKRFSDVVAWWATHYPPRLDAEDIAAAEVQDTLSSAKFDVVEINEHYYSGTDVMTVAYEPWFEMDPEPSTIVLVRRRCQCGKRVADFVIDWDYEPWTGEEILTEGRWVPAPVKKLCQWSINPRPTGRSVQKSVDALRRMVDEVRAGVLYAAHGYEDLDFSDIPRLELENVESYRDWVQRVHPGELQKHLIDNDLRAEYEDACRPAQIRNDIRRQELIAAINNRIHDELKPFYKQVQDARREYLKRSKGKSDVFRGFEEVLTPPRHAVTSCQSE